MKRLIVKISIVLAVVLVVISALVVFAPRFIPPSMVISFIDRGFASRINSHAAADNISVQILPTPGYVIDGFGLYSDDPAFLGKPILKASRVEGDFSVLDLIKGSITTSLAITNPSVELEWVDGKSNVAGIESVASNDDESDSNSIRFSEVTVERGKLVMDSDAYELPVSIEEISMLLTFTGDQLFDISASAQLVSEDRSKIGISGTIGIDSEKHVVSGKSLQVGFAGTSIVVDGSLAYDSTPIAFNVNIASSNISSGTIQKFLSIFGRQMPESLTLDGGIAADVGIGGTSEEFKISAQLDAKDAELAYLPYMVKKKDDAAKCVIKMNVSPAMISVEDGNVAIGKNVFILSGTVLRENMMDGTFKIIGDNLIAEDLTNTFTNILPFESLESPAFKLDLSGQFKGEGIPSVVGEFAAARAELAGFAVSNLELNFSKMADLIELTQLKGLSIGGSLSGTGKLKVVEGRPEYSIDLLADSIDLAGMDGASDVVSGKGTVVAKLSIQDGDEKEPGKKVVLDGNIVVPSGSFINGSPVLKLFDGAIWDVMQAYGMSPVDAILSGAVAKISRDFSEFSSSFKYSKGSIAFSSAKFATPLFDVEVDFNADGLKGGAGDALKNVGGKGKITFSKEFAGAMARTPAAKKRFLDKSFKFELPVVISGNVQNISVAPDVEKLDASEIKPAEAAVSPAQKVETAPTLR